MFASLVPHVSTGALLVTLRGRLSIVAVDTTRRALAISGTHYPHSIIVDCVQLRPGRRAANALLPVVLRRAGRMCGTALVVCTPNAALRQRLTARRRYAGLTGDAPVQVHDSLGAALQQTREYPTRAGVHRAHLRLPASPQAPTQARRLVADACRAWGLECARDSAELVISELVSNAAEHARTEMDVTIYHRDGELRLGVADRSPLLPAAARRMPDVAPGGHQELSTRGRGLPLIAHYASRWGVLTGAHGKLVWASLALPRARHWRLARIRNAAWRAVQRVRFTPVALRPRLA